MKSEASLLDAARQLARAEREGDVSALERLVAADYVGHDPAGRSQDRPGVLRAYADGSLRLALLEEGQLTARVFGDLGLVAGVYAMEGAERATRFDLHLRFLDVYVWRDEHWQLIASQATYLP